MLCSLNVTISIFLLAGANVITLSNQNNNK